MNRDTIEQVLRDYDAMRLRETDPDLEAVSTAILIEDVFGVVLSDAEIAEAGRADRSSLATVVAQLVEKST